MSIDGSGDRLAGEVPWARFLIVPAIVSFGLLVLPQIGFIWMSFHADLGLGQVSDTFTLANYATIFSDRFTLGSIWITAYLSASATAIGLALAFPTGFALSRAPAWLARTVLGLVLTTSLVTIVIKLMGLNLLLGSSGALNQALLSLGFAATPLAFTNNQLGVLIGLVQYTLPILILMLFNVAQTIPPSLEEAAAIHGATRAVTFWRVIVPQARVGLVGGGLIAFNMCMGAFTSAVLLGGGRVKTIPVLIQEQMMQSTNYAMAAALSTVLLVCVFAVNVGVSVLVLRRRGVRSRAQHAGVMAPPRADQLGNAG